MSDNDDSEHGTSSKLKRKFKKLIHYHKNKENYDVNVDDIHEVDIKDLSLEKRAAYRDAINTAAMFSRCEEVEPDMLNQEDHLDRGDFVIARMVWDEDKEKYHDHWSFVLERKEDGIDVIFISDISKDGEKPEQAFWGFAELIPLIQEGKLHILRFNLLDVQDPDDLVLSRAKIYSSKNSQENSRALQFAYLSIFGLKEPVFTDHHLSLCEDKTLLLLRSDATKEIQQVKPLLLHDWNSEDSDGNAIFNVSFEEDDEDIKEMTYEDILNLLGEDDATLFYYPGVQVESLKDLNEQMKKELTHDAMHSTVEVTLVHMTEHALENALIHTFSGVFSHGVLQATAQFGGGALHGVVAASVATHKTRKARRKEKLFEKTGGLTGFSRTKANKEITKNWSSAVAGTGGSLGLGLAGAAAGTMLFPGVGTFVGGVIGGVLGSVTAGGVGKKISGKIFDLKIKQDCPLC